jgi:hypothetical protein
MPAILSNPSAREGDKQLDANRRIPAPMTRLDEILAAASKLPLRDAAFELWRQKSRLDQEESALIPPEKRPPFVPVPREEFPAWYKYQRDHAQDGPTFDRLKRAHPQADDVEAKLAIIAAVRFDDACFQYFTVDSTDYWDRVVRAVALAQRQEKPGYLESTYDAACNHVAYYMK